MEALKVYNNALDVMASVPYSYAGDGIRTLLDASFSDVYPKAMTFLPTCTSAKYKLRFQFETIEPGLSGLKRGRRYRKPFDFAVEWYECDPLRFISIFKKNSKKRDTTGSYCFLYQRSKSALNQQESPFLHRNAFSKRARFAEVQRYYSEVLSEHIGKKQIEQNIIYYDHFSIFMTPDTNQFLAIMSKEYIESPGTMNLDLFLSLL